MTPLRFTLFVLFIVASAIASPPEFSGFDKKGSRYAFASKSGLWDRQTNSYREPHFSLPIIVVRDDLARQFLRQYGLHSRSFAEIDTFHWQNMPFFESNPFRLHDRIGLHDPERGIYFTAEIDSFRISPAGELKYTVDLVAKLSLIDDNRNIDAPPFFQLDSLSELLVAWYPKDVANDSTGKYHPAGFDGIRYLPKRKLQLPSYPYRLNDSLRFRGLERKNEIFSWQLVNSCAGDDSGRVDYLHYRGSFATDTSAGVHDILLKRAGYRFSIVNIWTSRQPMGKKHWDEYRANDIYSRYERHSFRLVGPVDLEFDGIYEIVIDYWWNDLGGTHGGWEKYILDCSGQKPRRIGRFLGGSSC